MEGSARVDVTETDTGGEIVFSLMRLRKQKCGSTLGLRQVLKQI